MLAFLFCSEFETIFLCQFCNNVYETACANLINVEPFPSGFAVDIRALPLSTMLDDDGQVCKTVLWLTSVLRNINWF